MPQKGFHGTWNQIFHVWKCEFGRDQLFQAFQRDSEIAFLPEASFGLRVLSLPVSVCLSVCVSVNPELVRAITHHVFMLEPPNLDKNM